ncbi:Hypothetical predicted protein [Paramuricea clavata]|uniref:Uncharacterized protein n=1 Tax=Paramuricea clavata TaxID=317549 RepID=A0A6S7HUV4_PARCT|nr:Hypothetical predicted protein [Paramuricea clavata]
MDSFNEDLKVLNLDDDYDLPLVGPSLLINMEICMQQHAPQKRRIITLRPSSPRYNEDIGKEKINRRKLEE